MNRDVLIFVVLLMGSDCFSDFEAITEDTIFALSKRDFTCGPTFCRNVICPEITHCPKELVLRKGSLCGCCSKCISYRSENEPCVDTAKQLQIGGVQHKCKTGLECKNGKCTKESSLPTCNIVVEWRKFLKNDPANTNIFTEHLWIPECDEAGKYRAKQCKMKKCLCFDENGNKLFGQAERNLAENMTCGCSRAMAHLQKMDQSRWMIMSQEHCTKSGDYDELQCVGDICYCANATTGEVIGRVTKVQFMELLPCYDKKKVGKGYNTQCELQLMRTQSLRYHFHRKNIDVIGLEKVRCDIDGTFAAKQCKTDRCVCTDRKGTGIKSFDIESRKRELVVAMQCNCARDEYDRETAHAHYRRMACDAGGNFIPLQCFDESHCYCVDEDGDIISKQLAPMENLEELCKYLLRKLHNPYATEDPEYGTTEDPEYGTTEEDYYYD